MSATGRPKRESHERQREGSPINAPGRPERAATTANARVLR